MRWQVKVRRRVTQEWSGAVDADTQSGAALAARQLVATAAASLHWEDELPRDEDVMVIVERYPLMLMEIEDVDSVRL